MPNGVSFFSSGGGEDFATREVLTCYTSRVPTFLNECVSWFDWWQSTCIGMCVRFRE